MRGVLATSSGAESHDLADLVARARSAPPMSGRDLTGEVGCRRLLRVIGSGLDRHLEPVPEGGDAFAGGDGPRVVVLDFGVKHGILDGLAEAGARIVMAPARTTAALIHDLRPDGIVLSNGPGDPAAVDYGIATVGELLGQLPMLGICLGHQLLALALGLATEKLPFGHHGANHPVKDLTTGRVLVTSQNHGFAVSELPADLRADIAVTHRSLYDGTIEGLAAPSRRARSVQFHPEASPGPHDAAAILHHFVHGLATERAPCRRAATSTVS
jgi:carbamoyl-phosphate synthase small subunit